MYYVFKLRNQIILMFGILFLGSCDNWFARYADVNNEQYRIDMAERMIDELDFDSAIDYIEPVLDNKPNNKRVVYLAAAAHAGRAGLRVLELFLAIGEELGDKTLLQIFAEHFVEVSEDDLADIEDAVTIIEDYGATASERDSTLNFFALFLYYSRIGVILNYYAFLDASIDLDPSWDACLIDAANGLPEEEIDKLMNTLARVVDTTNEIASSGGAFAGLTDMDMSSFNTFPMDPIPCPGAGADALLCTAVRNLMNDGTIGLDTGAAICL